VSIAEVSVRAGVIIALALVALLLSGRRKPARPWQRAPRGVQGSHLAIAVDRRGRRVLVPVDRRPNRLEMRLGAPRLASTVAGLGVIGLLVGAIATIALAVGMSWAVTTVTDLLQ